MRDTIYSGEAQYIGLDWMQKAT